MSEWDKALADAKKILGSSAVIPVSKAVAVDKTIAEFNKVAHAFEVSRAAHIKKIDALIGELQNKVVEIQNAGSKIKNALGAADDEISGSNYKLDPKKPDDKKKIDAAQAMFSKYFAEREKSVDTIIKSGTDYDKNLVKLKNQLDV